MMCGLRQRSVGQCRTRLSGFSSHHNGARPRKTRLNDVNYESRIRTAEESKSSIVYQGYRFPVVPF